jgi:predicted nuclease of predicted toxin-antitoxin system
MKLLFGQNLSFKLCRQIADLFPDSNQVRQLGLAQADDQSVWEYAKANGFTIVSLDSDFAELVTLAGPPPKLIWLRCGNQPTARIEKLLREHAELIAALDRDGSTACLEIY